MDAVHHQRRTLCDLLESLSDEQWGAETLCTGWDAGDVVAHMLVREREPWTSVGMVVPPLLGLSRRRLKARKAEGRETLIAQLRSGPPRPATMGPLGRVQVAEDYIHTEDIRRGGAAALPGDADLTPDDGTGDAAIDDILWGAIGRFALQTLGGLDAGGTLVMTDGGRTRAYRVGGRLARPAGGGTADVTIAGPSGELLLHTTGRTAAQVKIQGDQALIDALDAKSRRV